MFSTSVENFSIDPTFVTIPIDQDYEYIDITYTNEMCNSKGLS